MDFEGIVHLVLPVVKGQGARGEWTKQEVVFELPSEFNRKICVGFWNERSADAAALRIGDRIAVSANVESRERNGRWFTEVRGWKMSRIEMQPISSGYGGGQQGYGAPQSAGGYNQGGYQQQQPQGGYNQGYGAPQNQWQQQPNNEAAPAPADDLPF